MASAARLAARLLAVVAAPVALAQTAACSGGDTTSVSVEVTTDVPCDAAGPVTTAITAGRPADLDTRPITAQTTRCDAATGRVGSLVLVPSDAAADDADVAVRVVMALHGKAPSACASDAADCIVETRTLRFVPGEIVSLPIQMSVGSLATGGGAGGGGGGAAPPPTEDAPKPDRDDGKKGR